MATATRRQRRYDHRLRDLVRTTRDIDGAVQRGVPRSTARSWMRQPTAEVVTVDVLERNASQLQQEILRLRSRVQKLTALLRVLLVVFRMSGYALNQSRLPEGSRKQPETAPGAARTKPDKRNLDERDAARTASAAPMLSPSTNVGSRAPKRWRPKSTASITSRTIRRFPRQFPRVDVLPNPR